MSFGSYAVGVLRLLAIVGPVVLTARMLRHAIAPAWSGALAVLAEVVLSLSAVVVTGEILGTFGAFRALPLILGFLALGVGTALATRRRAGDRSPPSVPGRPRSRIAWSEAVAMAAATGLVTAMWATWVANAVDFGIGDSDSNWYHLPFAAGFAQTGWLSRPQFVNAEALVTYYPANASLLHSIGFVGLGNDFLSIMLNLALVPAALLAAWCIGEGSRSGAASLAGVAITLTVPIVAISQAGSAKDDILSLVALLAAVAFVVHPDAGGGGDTSTDARPRLAGALLSGLAAGLAVGTKLTMLVPVAALGVCLCVVAGRRRRTAAVARMVAGTMITGSYWYVRNLAVVGNPVPSLHLGVGRLHLPRPAVPSIDNFASTVLQHVTDVDLWRHVLIPGAADGLGVFWFVIVAVAALGLGLGIVTGTRAQVAAAVVGAAATVAYLVTPGAVYGTPALGVPGAEDVVRKIFAYNLRYLLPPLALGLALLPIAMSRWRAGRLVVLAGFGAALTATQLGASATRGWATGHQLVAVVAGIAVFAGMLGLRAILSPVDETAPRAHDRTEGRATGRRAAAAAAAVATVGLALWPVQVRYRSRRFSQLPLAQWAAGVQEARIAYAGFALSYPLYGPQLRNRVQYLGERGPSGSWHPVGSCPSWRDDLRRGGYSFVVVPVGPPSPVLGYDLARWRLGLPGGEPPDEPPESRWTRTDPGARVVFVGEGAAVYAVAGQATSEGCGS